MPQKVELTLYNYSNDANNSEIVIFQKNVAASIDELTVAWKVIQNLARGNYHPFSFPLDLQVGASDSWGNYSPKIDAYPGQSFQMHKSSSGDSFGYQGQAVNAIDIDVNNNMPKGAMNANIYRDGKVLAAKTGVAPGQKAEFRFKPTIFIGVVSQVEQGQVMDSAIVSQINSEISLLGVRSADIYMTGGGPGPESTPFKFVLQNVQYS